MSTTKDTIIHYKKFLKNYNSFTFLHHTRYLNSMNLSQEVGIFFNVCLFLGQCTAALHVQRE